MGDVALTVGAASPHDALDPRVIGALWAGTEHADHPTIAIAWEVPLHSRDGRPQVRIGLARVRVPFARPPIEGAPRQADHATSSLSGDAAGPEMINHRPLLVAGAAMSPRFSRSSSMVS